MHSVEVEIVAFWLPAVLMVGLAIIMVVGIVLSLRSKSKA